MRWRAGATAVIVRDVPAPVAPSITEAAYDALASQDMHLRDLIAQVGQPDPFSWDVLDDREFAEPLPELAFHIVGQQITTRAAVVIFGRLEVALGGAVAVQRVLAASPERLRSAGLSGAKARSLRDLAERVADGRLSFERLAASGDDDAVGELEAVRGIGPWSAQMFLLHHLRRPDVFPAADIGLLRAAMSAFGLPTRPTAPQLAARAEAWRPFRSYAAALLWAHGRAVRAR